MAAGVHAGVDAVTAPASPVRVVFGFGEVSDLVQDSSPARLITNGLVKPGRRTTKAAPAKTSGERGAPDLRFPFTRAFVVQFGEGSGAATTAFEGRVEHLHTGHRDTFDNSKALVALLVAMLSRVDNEASDAAEAARAKPRGRRSGRRRDGIAIDAVERGKGKER